MPKFAKFKFGLCKILMKCNADHADLILEHFDLTDKNS
jgi:hypothetical protein